MSVCYSVQAEPDLPQGAELETLSGGRTLAAGSPGGTIEEQEPKPRLPMVSIIIIYHLNFKFGRTQVAVFFLICNV